MDLNKPRASLTPTEQEMATEHFSSAKPYGGTRKVWVEDGHVFVEGDDGQAMSMTPEVAIAMGRLFTEAGSDSLVNRVMDESPASRKRDVG